MVIAFWGCKDELNKTGYDLLLPGDLVSARKVILDKDLIKAYTVSDLNLWTNKPELSLLGTFNDPVFGKSTTDFAYQFRLRNYTDFTNAEFDSLILTLVYKETYGDRVTPQNLTVYELNSDLDADAIYYQNTDLKSMAKTEVLANLMYVPKFELDSLSNKYGSTKEDPKDTVIQEIRFNLNVSLAQKLMAADSIQRSDNDSFLKYFKGLYIEAGDLNQGGGIIRINPSLVDEKMVAHNTEMDLYYHLPNDTNKYFVRYLVNSTSARTSRFKHDYSTTSFYENLDHQNQQDSLIYLQTTGGLSSKIFINSLSSWKDSTDCAINKAELIFRVEKSLIDTSMYPVPQKLILSLIDSNGSIYANEEKRTLIYPSDLLISEAYYGGTYNKNDTTYRFNLAKHLQEIIKGKTVNYGFYLSTAEKNSIFRRVVLKGATSQTGIGFEVTYSKIK